MIKSIIILSVVIILTTILYIGYVDSNFQILSQPQDVPYPDRSLIRQLGVAHYGIIDEYSPKAIHERAFSHLHKMTDGDIFAMILIRNHPGYPDIVFNSTDNSIVESIIRGDHTVCFPEGRIEKCVDSKAEYVLEMVNDFSFWVFDNSGVYFVLHWLWDNRIINYDMVYIFPGIIIISTSIVTAVEFRKYKKNR